MGDATKKKMFNRLVEIRDRIEQLEAERAQIRTTLMAKMEIDEKIYGKTDMLEKSKKEFVELHSKKRIFHILGEDKYIELSSIGVSNLRGNISDRKLDKLIKNKYKIPQLTLRSLL